jgi:hypothetical protein
MRAVRAHRFSVEMAPKPAPTKITSYCEIVMLRYEVVSEVFAAVHGQWATYMPPATPLTRTRCCILEYRTEPKLALGI